MKTMAKKRVLTVEKVQDVQVIEKITHAGDRLQKLVLGVLPNAIPQSRGDVLWQKHRLILIENKDGAINQVRPIQGCILVQREKKNGQPTGFFNVVPHTDVCKMALRRIGQHTQDSAACVSFGQLDQKYRCTLDQLPQMIEAAAMYDDAHPSKAQLSAFLADRAAKYQEFVQQNQMFAETL